MQEVFKIFILSTIVITFWTAFLLLQDKRGNSLLNRWFAAFLLALTTPQMDLYAGLVAQGGIFQLSLVASTFLWLKGPFVWIFIKVLTRKDVSLKKMWFHFLPWFISLSLLLIFPHLFYTVVLFGMSHMLMYLLLSMRQVIKKRHYITEIWHGFRNTAYYWLMYIIGGLMLLVAVDFVVMSLVALGFLASYNLLDFFVFPFFSVYVLSIGVLSVYRPDLLFRDAVEQSSRSDLIAAGELACVAMASDSLLATTSDSKERYLELDEKLAQTLIQNLSQSMQAQSLYRQNELSLMNLAELLGISVHQVSELLNVHLGISFYEYINGYRLKYACHLLGDSNCHLRILDIAFESGFNNKNSFYRAFKDALGVTPNQYRTNALELKGV